MGRISETVAPTATFDILLRHSDAGFASNKRKKKLLVALVIIGTLALISIVIGLLYGVVLKKEDLNSNSDKIIFDDNDDSNDEDDSNEVDEERDLDNDDQILLLIGGKNSKNEYIDTIEAIGGDCPKLKK